MALALPYADDVTGTISSPAMSAGVRTTAAMWNS